MGKWKSKWFSAFMAAILLFGGLWPGLGVYKAKAAGPTIIYVKMGGNDGNDGASWNKAVATLQQALDKAIAGNQIWIAAGTYSPTGNGIGPERHFEMKNGVSIYGGFVGNEVPGFSLGDRNYTTNKTILSGDFDGSGANKVFHVFYHESLGLDQNAILDGVTITGGSNHGYGGGMYNSSSSPTLTNVTISGNSAYDGGGMFNINSSPTLTNVTISGNSASYGGGIFNTNNSNPTMTNVTISGNSASYGGGMYNETSSPTLMNVTISGNTAGTGGGVLSERSSLILMNVTISGNTANYSQGGGMYNREGSLTLTNVKISGNTAIDYGGGMYNLRSSPTLMNVTISDSTAEYGGGMYNVGSSPTLTNVTISGSKAKYGGGMYNVGSSPTLKNVTISGGNTNDWFGENRSGGGMHNYDNSSPTLTNVTISGNASDQGGGMYNEKSSSPTLTNVTISGNTAGDGSGMYNYDNSSPTLTNVTISGNKARYGGGMYNRDQSNPKMRNSIIWGNTSTFGFSILGTITNINNSLIEGSGGSDFWKTSFGVDGGGNIDKNPMFQDFKPAIELYLPTTEGNYSLKSDSPAIDTGDKSVFAAGQNPDLSGINTDLGGKPRIVGAQVDMGAYEWATTIKELKALPAPVNMRLGANNAQQLLVKATLLDDTEDDVTSSTKGTTYTSGDPTAATVTVNGLVEAKKLGTTTITIANSRITTTVQVNVISNTYTVGFEVDGGSTVANVNAEYNTTITAPTVPTKANYSFGGWYKESGLTNPWNFTTDKVLGATTLHAKWTPNTYTVGFEVDGGSAVANVNAEYNTTITAPTAPTKVNYSFGGWYKESGLTNPWNFTTDKVLGATTLHAKWTPNTYAVGFEVDGGSAVANVNAEYNTTITAPAVPTKANYSFGGWYKESGLTNPWNFTTDKVLGATTLHAKWTIIQAPTYTVGLTATGLATGTLTVPAQVAGYTPAPVTVTISKTGTGNVTNLAVAKTADEATRFTLGTLSGTTADGTASPTFTITPIAGSTVGTYTATVTVTGDTGVSTAITVTFTVKAAPTYTVGLTATGLAAGTLTVPTQVAGYTPAPVTVTISKTGTGNVTNLALAKTADAATRFTLGTLSGTTADGTASPTFTITPIAGTKVGTYTATVTVTGDTGVSTAITVTFTVTAAPAVLAAPTNLVVTAVDSQINLTWSSVTGATYYNVYQSLDNSTYHLISIPATVTTAYQVTGLINGSLYYFKTSAANTVTESTYSNVASATPYRQLSNPSTGGTPTPTTAPPAPTSEPTQPKVDVFKSSIVNVVNLIKTIEYLVAEAKKSNVKINLGDIKGHWAEKTIDRFVKLHLIEGYVDGQFKPNGDITRAEFATLISRVFEISGGTSHSVALNDVSNHWAKDAIEKLASEGVLGGYSDGTFKPDQTISREEIVIILSRIVNLGSVNKDTSKGNFTDISRASSYAANSIKDAAEAGIIDGKNGGKFDPQGNATRAEALTVILNALNLHPQLKMLLDSLN